MADTVTDDELHRVVVNCVIYEDRRYLIARRAPHLKIFPDKWEISGGGLSSRHYEHLQHSGPDGTWENVLQMCLREELKEELGVAVDNVEPVGNCAFKRSDGVRVVGFRYMGRFVPGPVVLNFKEVVDYRWITVDEIPRYDFLGNVPDVIQRVDEILARRGHGGAAY